MHLPIPPLHPLHSLGAHLPSQQEASPWRQKWWEDSDDCEDCRSIEDKQDLARVFVKSAYTYLLVYNNSI